MPFFFSFSVRFFLFFCDVLGCVCVEIFTSVVVSTTGPTYQREKLDALLYVHKKWAESSQSCGVVGKASHVAVRVMLALSARPERC